MNSTDFAVASHPNSPVVSVLMPVRNGASHLDEAIGSIVNQTFERWELVVVDDGSTDITPMLLERWAQSDQRIRVIRQAPLGLVAASNAAVAAARGRYLARLDSDDIAHPQRLARQVACMERRPGLVAIGSAIRLFGERKGVLFTPMTDWGCRGRLLFENCFAHSSVMVRGSTVTHLGPLYEEHAEFAEDLALWLRLAPLGQFANLPFPLVKYRVHRQQISREKALTLRGKHAMFAVAQWSQQGVNVSSQDFLRFRWPDFQTEGSLRVARHSLWMIGRMLPMLLSRFAPQALMWMSMVLLRNAIKTLCPWARRFL